MTLGKLIDHAFLRKLATPIIVLATVAVCFAQKPDEQTATLQVRSHLTIEDVVVTDAAGKAVRGLPQSAFHVTDDGAAQAIRNFNESSSADVSVPAKALPRGTFSNAGLTDRDASVDVLMIDPVSIEIADQMFLRVEALRYLKSMPEGTTIAVFRTSRDGRPLLVQSFTQDRALLIKAVNNSIPTFAVTVPPDEVFYNAIGEVSNIADYLAQAEGRKSLIWFAGRFPLAQTLGGNGAQESAQFSETEEALKTVYRKLEAARVAVFPIDVRGLVNAGLNVNLQAGTDPSQARGPNQLAGGSAEVQGSGEGMDALAAATGGRAFHGNNHVAEQIAAAVDLGRHYYTLSYSAQPFVEDGKWHKVHIAVDGGYKASYREGYFAQSSAATERRVLAGLRGHEAPAGIGEAPSTLPIVFVAKVRPGSEKPSGQLVIQYAITTADLQFRQAVDGKQQASLKVAALAYNTAGTVLSSTVDDVRTHFTDEQMAQAQKVGVPVVQQMTVARGAKFLLLSVLDVESGRTGTIQLTVDSANQTPK